MNNERLSQGDLKKEPMVEGAYIGSEQRFTSAS